MHRRGARTTRLLLDLWLHFLFSCQWAIGSASQPSRFLVYHWLPYIFCMSTCNSEVPLLQRSSRTSTLDSSPFLCTYPRQFLTVTMCQVLESSLHSTLHALLLSTCCTQTECTVAMMPVQLRLLPSLRHDALAYSPSHTVNRFSVDFSDWLSSLSSSGGMDFVARTRLLYKLDTLASRA